MRALAEAAVDAVERTLDGNVNVLLVDLAVSASVLGVAHAGAVVAPTGVAAVVGAGLDAAVLATKSGLTPASTVQAQTIVGTVAEANGNRAVSAMKVGVARAGAVVTVSVTTAVLGAHLD